MIGNISIKIFKISVEELAVVCEHTESSGRIHNFLDNHRYLWGGASEGRCDSGAVFTNKNDNFAVLKYKVRYYHSQDK